jgi:hypothetical protein
MFKALDKAFPSHDFRPLGRGYCGLNKDRVPRFNGVMLRRLAGARAVPETFKHFRKEPPPPLSIGGYCNPRLAGYGEAGFPGCLRQDNPGSPDRSGFLGSTVRPTTENGGLFLAAFGFFGST